MSSRVSWITDCNFFTAVCKSSILQSTPPIHSASLLPIAKRFGENPDITVVLTMHNQAHCIHKALRSIQNQSVKSIEILVMLDCSYDNSTETIKKYMEEDEKMILSNHHVKSSTLG